MALGLLAVALLIFFMDPLLAALRDDVELTALFESAPRVVPGAEVWIAGHRVGSVTTVAFLPVPDSGDPRLALTLAIPRDRLSQVRRDATVRLTSARLVGEPVIDILPGSPDAPPFEAGDTLFAEPEPTGADIVARAAALRAAVDTLLLASAPVNERARARMAALGRIQAGFAGTQRELEQLSATMAASPALALAHDPAVTRALARMRSVRAELGASGPRDTAMARMQSAFGPLTRHAAELSSRLDALRAMGGDNGTLARLQNDSALAVALRSAQAQLDSLIAEARDNPARFVF